MSIIFKNLRIHVLSIFLKRLDKILNGNLSNKYNCRISVYFLRFVRILGYGLGCKYCGLKVTFGTGLSLTLG